jgi:hypothetical protein
VCEERSAGPIPIHRRRVSKVAASLRSSQFVVGCVVMLGVLSVAFAFACRVLGEA